MKKAVIVPATALVVACLLLIGMAGTSFAAPVHPPFGSFTNASGVPAGSKLVLNISYKVTNDEDSGNVGYWALDDYNKSVQVWQVSEDSFYAVARYTGQWQTFEGALSPEDGAREAKDASGTFEGGYVATFTADGFTSAFGNIGTYDLGGTKADILTGTYGSGQTGDANNPFSYLSTYFTDASGFSYTNWGWTYHYKSQSWNNFSTETTGDIVD